MRAAALPIALALGLLVTGCESGTTPPLSVDATPEAAADDTQDELTGPDVPTDPGDAGTDVPGDARTDAGPPGAVFGPCSTASTCPGPMGVCLGRTDGYPGGLCTRSCTLQSQCGENGVCLPFGTGRRCFRRCDTSADCRDAYRCFLAVAMDPVLGDVRACFPFCSTDAQCPGGTCNVYSRFCEALDTTRADNGAPCQSGSGCRSGRCFTETNAMGNPTGELDGYCYSRCTNPPDAQYQGPTLPQGDCPANSVCVRETNPSAPDVALCHLACTTASDCRPGFICLHPTRLGSMAQTTNGYCAAMNCHYMTQMCPPTATCQTTRTDDAGVPTSGVCQRLSDGGMGGAGGDNAASAGD